MILQLAEMIFILKNNPARFIYTIKDDFYKQKIKVNLIILQIYVLDISILFYQILICLNGLLSIHIMFVWFVIYILIMKKCALEIARFA